VVEEKLTIAVATRILQHTGTTYWPNFVGFEYPAKQDKEKYREN
jgi:hypothetical protein